MKRSRKHKYFYTVHLKLDSRDNRGCYCRPYDKDDTEYIQHVSYGWYRVGVFAFDEESALRKAKKALADYKDVKVKDFFEHTSYPKYWSDDYVMVCPECGKQYSISMHYYMEYDMCPACRRRCKFVKAPKTKEA